MLSDPIYEYPTTKTKPRHSVTTAVSLNWWNPKPDQYHVNAVHVISLEINVNRMCGKHVHLDLDIEAALVYHY